MSRFVILYKTSLLQTTALQTPGPQVQSVIRFFLTHLSAAEKIRMCSSENIMKEVCSVHWYSFWTCLCDSGSHPGGLLKWSVDGDMCCLFGQPRCNTVWLSEAMFTLRVVRKGRLISGEMGELAASFSPFPSRGHVSPIKLGHLCLCNRFGSLTAVVGVCISVFAILCASTISLRSTLCREVNDLVLVAVQSGVV